LEDAVSVFRNRFLSVSVLLMAFGVVSYFATWHVHDPSTSSTTLFAFSWIFSSFGILAAAGTIFSFASDGDEEDSDYKAPPKLSAMRYMMGLIFGVTVVVWGLLVTMNCMNADGFDGPRFMALYFSALAGEALGFLALSKWHFDKSWTAHKLPQPRTAADAFVQSFTGQPH
jgi:hypothetical protein